MNMAAFNSMLTPLLALCLWTFVMWVWMYATRIPAMQKARIDPRKVKGKQAFDALPPRVNWVADNYNHLHEQPTVFYALCIYSHLAGANDIINVALAWAYVGLRVIHSFVQVTTNYVPVRFYLFAISSLALIAITLRNVVALFLLPPA